MASIHDQRSFERLPFGQKVRVVAMGRMVVYAMAINVGMGGVLLKSAPFMPIGGKCRLDLPGNGPGRDGPVAAEGVVVRNSSEGTAVRFEHPLDAARFRDLMARALPARGAFLAAYRTYFRVGQDRDLAGCETWLGISKRAFRTTFSITFPSCIAAAILPVWFLRASLPVAPAWEKVALSFVYAALWLLVIQPTLDLTVFRVLRWRRSRRPGA